MQEPRRFSRTLPEKHQGARAILLKHVRADYLAGAFSARSNQLRSDSLRQQIPGVDVRAKVLLEQNGMSNLRDLQTVRRVSCFFLVILST